LSLLSRAREEGRALEVGFYELFYNVTLPEAADIFEEMFTVCICTLKDRDSTLGQTQSSMV
jgi:hypothetical protein